MKEVLPLLKPADEESILLKPITRTSSFFVESEAPIIELPSPVEEISVEAIISRQVAPALVDGDISAQDAFFVADLGEISRQHNQFKSLMSRVEPFYAVKCNPDKRILQRLARLGANFDCASQAEIGMVLDLGVDPSRIIYANPCKQASHLRYAYEHGVRMMTFDNVDELHKIKQYAPSAQMVIRILTDDSKSICKLGAKFGVSQKNVPVLLETAAALEMNVIGVSFHVGSGCYHAQSFGDAVELASKVFEVAQSYGYNFTLLDIGGGFPGRNASGIKFAAIAEVVCTALEQFFPSRDIRVIAEPGRYYASSAYTLITNVTARRTEHLETDESIYMYYINDGMYGSFNCITFDHATVTALPLTIGGSWVYGQTENHRLTKCSIWGPTCDSIDCMGKDLLLPTLSVGDFIYFENMGAYTSCAASVFNGFKKTQVIYTDTELDSK